jgi:hypothetical protein
MHQSVLAGQHLRKVCRALQRYDRRRFLDGAHPISRCDNPGQLSFHTVSEFLQGGATIARPTKRSAMKNV